MEYKESLVDIAEIDIPPMLYKYRSWQDNYHKTILTRQEVFMSPPSWFEDEKDCRVYRKLDFTDGEIFDIYFKWLMKENKGIPAREICFQSIVLTQNAPLKDEKYLEVFKVSEFEQLDNMVGILSVQCGISMPAMGTDFVSALKAMK
jgi:hypothetical protein